MKTITIQFNKDFLEFRKGQTIQVSCDSEKTPIEQRFRKLLRDSEIDNTVSIVKTEKQIKSTKSTKSQKIKGSDNVKD